MSKYHFAKLGELTKIRTGKLDANASSKEGKYPFFTCSREPLKIDNYSYDCECVLVAGNGDLNVKYYYGKFDAYQRTYIIESINKQKLYTPYLYVFLNKYVEKLREQAIGGVIKYIKLSNLTDAIIPLPLIEEQKKIANILGKARNLISLRKKQIDKLDLLIKCRFIEMFGDPVLNPKRWKVSTLRKTSKRISDGPFGSNLKSEHYVNEGVRVIRLQNIGVGEFIDNDKAFISAEHHKKLEKYTCFSGDIIIGTIGNPNMRACILPDNLGVAINKADCIHYQPDHSVLSNIFACNYINNPSVQTFTYDKLHGQTRTRISMSQVAEIPIYLPPIELQMQFEVFVQQVEKLKFDLQLGLEKMELNNKALTQRYFK